MQVLTPLIFIIDKISGVFLAILHIDSSKKAPMTENELKTYVDVSHEDGVIEQEEKKLIYNVFDFGDSVAKDIMVPRIDMTSVDIDATYDEVMEIFRESMYSRIPVYEDEIDNIIGIVIVKDFLLVDDKNNFHIRDIIREGYYTYEYKKTADLLIEMRLITTNVAFVLNEYGATVGMISVEDLLEEIVGEIRDEFDEDEAELLKELGENEYEVSGSMKLDDINEMLGTSFSSEDYDSIGGLMIELLDRFPVEGESVEMDDKVTLTAKQVENNRIETVIIQKSCE
jgi:CBS domain containing-hemolysin-like protein